MLDITTLVAVSIVGTAATPLNALPVPIEVNYSKNPQVAIREIAPELPFEIDYICTGCNPLKFTPAPAYRLTPERRALLNTIRFAEGTWKDGQDSGYRVMFGGRMVSTLDKHPNQVQYSSRYASAAAGAYQFLPGTWGEAAKELKLTDFGPSSQDQAALFLIDRRNALSLADSGKITQTLIAKLAPEWASLPTYSGNSYYNQPVKRFSELKQFYENNLSAIRQEENNV